MRGERRRRAGELEQARVVEVQPAERDGDIGLHLGALGDGANLLQRRTAAAGKHDAFADVSTDELTAER